MQKLIRVFIVEDHVIFLEGLKRVLSEIKDIKVVGETNNGQDFIDKLPKLDADVVLMDIRMPGMDGIQTTETALRIKPELKIIVFSMYGEADYLYSMILLGISGFVLKSSSLDNLEKAIRTVAAGEQFFSPELNMTLAKRLRQMSNNDLPSFTKKEHEILHLLCRGLSTHEIAEEMSISKRTVEGYRGKMLEKTGLSNTINLVIFAIRNRLVSIDDPPSDPSSASS